MSTQIEGLLLKNYQLMKRQKASMICQVINKINEIITPLLCLGFIALIKTIIETQLTNFGLNLKIELPLLMNLPLYQKLNYSNNLIRIGNCEEWYLYKFANESNQRGIDYFGNNDGFSSHGMLESQKNVFQSFCDSNKRLNPYFKAVNSSINDYLFKSLEELNTLDFNTLKQNENSIKNIPDGAIEIYNLNDTYFSYKLQVNDQKLRSYHRSNGVTKTLVYNPSRNSYSEVMNVINGALIICDLINSAYFRHFFSQDLLISGIQIFPLSSTEGENVQRVINISGSTFYPLAISLMMPLFMYTIILEKDAKLIEIMKINGLRMRHYWTSNFIFNMILYSITIIVYVIFGGCILGLTLFTETSYILQFIIYLGWGFNQIGLAYFFQAFLSNPRTATIIGYILSLWTTLLAVSLNYTIFNFPAEVPNFLILYPSFTITRIIYHLTIKCGYSFCIPSIYGIDYELTKCLCILYIVPWILIFLGIYLYEVLPQQYGVRKHPLFFLSKYSSKARSSNKKEKNIIDDMEMQKVESVEEEINNERIIIENLSEEEKFNYPLVAHNLTKIYVDNVVKPKLALNKLNLLLKNNEIFSLLGPNGAGKTTFFSLLTGIYEPSSGDATVGGNSIKTKIDKVQQLIGYCPQFDLLWNDLTVKEHLYFYSRLKNVDKRSTKNNVKRVLENIKLKEFENFLVRELSGGMKRRLSLGISLVGNPSIVFLDEPTTGLDPENKRQIWEILSNCKENKCMILTTHLMEEAEVLSDRIGIIINGELKCLGTQYKLRKTYGKGFKLVINVKADIDKENELSEEFSKIENLIKSIFPNSGIIEKYKNTLVFHIPSEEFNAEELFSVIEKRKSDLYINNWAISQVTLEDIFINLTEKDMIKL